MRNIYILKACEIAGSQAGLARFLDVTPQTVNQWISGAREIPATQCYPIETLTKGAVTRENLRDDWKKHWPELARRNRKAKNTPAEQSALPAE